jgi:antirestriction protein ArdC
VAERTPIAGERKDHVAEAMDKILTMVRDGKVPEAMAHHILRPVGGDRPSDHYSWGNRLLLALAGTEDARGYHAWLKAGRHVRKGARAIWILAPRTVTVKVVDEQTGEEQEQKRLAGFLGVPVFAAEDTEGEPLPQPSYEPPEVPPLMGACEAWGIKVVYGPTANGEYGYNAIAGGQEFIHLSSHDADTLWHELGHSAHRRILAREGKTLKSGQDMDQEVVAELVAATLGVMLGQPAGVTGWQIRYMESYSGSRESLVRNLIRLTTTAAECVELILDAAKSARASVA